MRVWFLPCMLSALALATPVSAAAEERVFDIVPPEGREVQTVDGYSVLRQAGTQFGAVLTFMPETDTSAWIPTAVLNTSGEGLKVGTHGVSARYGDTELKVWSTSSLIRLAKEGRISAPEALVATVSGNGTSPGRGGDAPLAPSTPDTIGPATPGGQSQRLDRGGSRTRRNNEQERQHDLAVAQVAALRERLFRDETLAPRTVGRGDVRINLPPRRTDGQPAEFVLTLSFGGESMDVRYRERVAAP